MRATPVLFGTTELSGVFAFATAKTACGHRSSPKVNGRGLAR
jgi:hypothetical protein